MSNEAFLDMVHTIPISSKENDVTPRTTEKLKQMDEERRRKYLLHCCHCTGCVMRDEAIVVSDQNDVKRYLKKGIAVCCDREDGWHDKWTIENGEPVCEKCTLMTEDTRVKERCALIEVEENGHVRVSDIDDPDSPGTDISNMAYMFDTNQLTDKDPTIPQEREYIYIWYDIEYSKGRGEYYDSTRDKKIHDVIRIDAAARESKSSAIPPIYPFLISNPIACVTANEIAAVMRAMNDLGKPIRSLLVKQNAGDIIIDHVGVEEIQTCSILPWKRAPRIDIHYTEANDCDPENFHIDNSISFENLRDHKDELKKYYKHKRSRRL